MFYITEWRPRFPTPLLCGHTIPTEGKAYKMTVSVCQQDVACLPQAIKAALQAQQTQVKGDSWLFKLWHWCFGKRRSATPQRNEQLPERRLKARAQTKRYTVKAPHQLHLDCGHTLEKGDVLFVTSIYHCQLEDEWPLTMLMACLKLGQQKQQRAAQAAAVSNGQTTKTVYRYNGHHQAHP